MAGTEHASPIIAARYASALFDIADERHALDQIAGDLETLKRLLSDNAELRAALRNPLYSKDAQGKAVAEIGKAAGLSPIVQSFLGVLAKNRRLFALSAIADAFLGELARRRGQMSVDVTSAQWCADNRLTGLKLSGQYPDIGDGDFTCDQLGRTYAGKLVVRPTPNPLFRRVDAVLLDQEGRQILLLSTVIGRNR